jgi:hypothetical protein
MQVATLPPAGHKASVTQALKYSRFGANKKRGAFFQMAACGRRLLAGPEGGR